MRFKDRVVIVTGGGSGIGRCIARTYAACGAKVVVADRDGIAGRQTRDLIAETGGDATFVLTDVGQPAEVIALVARTEVCSSYQQADKY